MSTILDSFKLTGKTALVTGAARGLGQGMALALAEAGADIVAVDILPAADTKRQVEALGKPQDVALGISTSGNSKNVLAAVKRAKEMGVFTVGFTGNTGGELKGLVDIPVVIPSKKTSRIQESHIMIGHILCECVDELIAQG